MNKMGLLLILFGVVIVIQGVTICYLGSRKEKSKPITYSTTFYMNYGSNEYMPRDVRIESDKPIDKNFPWVLLDVPRKNVSCDQVWFTDKQGNILESTEETGNQESRIWWVRVGGK